MKGALRHGKRIPEDLKLVAYDGTYITEIVTPEITAIVQPISQIADALVSIICDMVEGKKLKGHKVIFDVSVKYGGTTLGNITK